MSNEIIKITSRNIETGVTHLKISIEGDSEMPSSYDDLKVKAILELLESIDIKHYSEYNKQDQAYESAKEIINTTKAAFGLMYLSK